MTALSISGMAALMVGLAPANWYLIGVAGMALFGLMNPLTNGPLFAVMQARVEPEIQGRVFSFLHAGASLASPLGLIIAGPVADATNNNQLWFIIGGILTLLTGICAFFVPAIVEMGKEADQENLTEPTGKQDKDAFPKESIARVE